MDQVRLARSLRLLRHRRRWRQRDLAAKAGVARSAVSLLECGRAGELRLDVIERIGRALEARVDVRVDWRGAAIDRLLDGAHAGLVDDTVRRLGRTGWLVETEVSFEIRGERGSIDILAWHPVRRALLVVEVKSAFGDLQATLMSVARKVRLARIIARRFGWVVSSVARLLVVAETRTARRVVERHAALFSVCLPGARTGGARLDVGSGRIPVLRARLFVICRSGKHYRAPPSSRVSTGGGRAAGSSAPALAAGRDRGRGTGSRPVVLLPEADDKNGPRCDG